MESGIQMSHGTKFISPSTKKKLVRNRELTGNIHMVSYYLKDIHCVQRSKNCISQYPYVILIMSLYLVLSTTCINFPSVHSIYIKQIDFAGSSYKF